MLTAKAWVLDRIEQTFKTFIQNPIALITPLFAVNFVMMTIAPIFFMQYFFTSNIDNLNNIIQSLYILIVAALIYGIIYMILIIPATISTLKTSADILWRKKVSLGENIWYGFRKLWKAFSVYWYMFAYAYLVPAICFIVAWLIMIYGLYTEEPTIRVVWSILMWVAWLYALVQWVYRGLKSSFAVVAAVLHEDYSKSQFQKGILVTHNNWWRILGNFLLVWLIAWLSMGLITGLLGSISFLSSGINDFIPTNEEVSISDLQNTFSAMWTFNIWAFIIDSITQILSTIVTAFIMVFSMIFFMRLRDEAGQKTRWNTSPDIQVIDEL